MTVPTLDEDRALAPQGRIRDDKGEIIEVGILEAYKIISERKESGFYGVAKMNASDAKPPLPTLASQVQAVQPALEAEKKIIPINEEELKNDEQHEQPFKRGDIQFTPAGSPCRRKPAQPK